VAEMEYKCSAYYRPDLERGIAWNDSSVSVYWPCQSPILSEKDQKLPLLKEQKDLF